ncbi:hypothetical protein Sfulv_59380 [Streptomyces fulvorobeus]|uniref:Uncharacterized protein n=1 Tax=Streptomyces fulvorobeus TaxID=284028 RepID=A0A7J0CFV1_9ACTN|nr:hypothetical protein Sfulv_59380 [Streptomyces fulvorobeus]
MIRGLAFGLSCGVFHETAQPVGGRQHESPAQRVDPDHRPVDSCLAETTQPRMHLSLVPTLNDHFSLPRVRRGASSKPLPRVRLPPPPASARLRRPWPPAAGERHQLVHDAPGLAVDVPVQEFVAAVWN